MFPDYLLFLCNKVSNIGIKEKISYTNSWPNLP